MISKNYAYHIVLGLLLGTSGMKATAHKTTYNVDTREGFEHALNETQGLGSRAVQAIHTFKEMFKRPGRLTLKHFVALIPYKTELPDLKKHIDNLHAQGTITGENVQVLQELFGMKNLSQIILQVDKLDRIITKLNYLKGA